MVSQGQAEEHATHKCHAGELNSSLLSAIQDTVVECAGIKVKLQAAKPENYAELRTLAAGVSSCSDVHSSEDVQALFAIPTLCNSTVTEHLLHFWLYVRQTIGVC
eukprot:Lankesteria_metandrocarpae@DN2407_c0_g1_i2.p1